MTKGLRAISGMCLGAGLMYFFDPDRGRRRRGLVRDQVVRSAQGMEHFLDAACRDLQHRTQGVIAELSALVSSTSVSDNVLVDRVRSKMGRCVSHARTIEVEAHDGRITLRGPISAREVGALVSCVRSIPGVHGVDNELAVQSEDGVGELSLERGLRQENWSPGTRLLAMIAGTALFARGLRQGFPAGCVMGTIGAALIGRAWFADQRPPGIGTRSAAVPRAPGTARRASEPSFQI